MLKLKCPKLLFLSIFWHFHRYVNETIKKIATASSLIYNGYFFYVTNLLDSTLCALDACASRWSRMLYGLVLAFFIYNYFYLFSLLGFSIQQFVVVDGLLDLYLSRWSIVTIHTFYDTQFFFFSHHKTIWHRPCESFSLMDT